jgi:ribosomal protein S18 acetylase RimI-like enzyme
MEIEIKRTSEIGNAARERIAALFVAGFYDTALIHFSKDREKLQDTFAPMLALDSFYVAVVEGEIAGMAAYIAPTGSAFNLDRKFLRRQFGWLRGMVCHYAFKNQAGLFKLGADENTAIVFCLATAPEFTGQGVGTALMRRILELPGWEHFVLDVADTNVAAIGLYEKLGFCETGRRKAPKGSGADQLIFMRYDRN